MSGTVPRQDVTVSGSEAYTAGGLESDSATVTLSGFGNCKMWVRETLNVNLTENGNLNYYGTPSLTQLVCLKLGLYILIISTYNSLQLTSLIH